MLNKIAKKVSRKPLKRLSYIILRRELPFLYLLPIEKGKQLPLQTGKRKHQINPSDPIYRTIKHKVGAGTYLSMIHPSGKHSPGNAAGENHCQNSIPTQGIQRRSSCTVVIHNFRLINVLRPEMEKQVFPHY